jgi:hypothetical protein
LRVNGDDPSAEGGAGSGGGGGEAGTASASSASGGADQHGVSLARRHAQLESQLAAAADRRSSRSPPLGLAARPVLVLPQRDDDPFVPRTAALESALAPLSGMLPSTEPWAPNLRASGGLNEKDKWRQSPYWRYFRRVWGDAPFIDGNFRLWLSGALRGEFDKPRRPVRGQTTKALPAALRYFDSKYDPIIDTPFESSFDLFSQARPDATPTGSFYLQPTRHPTATPTGGWVGGWWWWRRRRRW